VSSARSLFHPTVSFSAPLLAVPEPAQAGYGPAAVHAPTVDSLLTMVVKLDDTVPDAMETVACWALAQHGVRPSVVCRSFQQQMTCSPRVHLESSLPEKPHPFFGAVVWSGYRLATAPHRRFVCGG
jgi:hypothetical protein